MDNEVAHLQCSVIDSQSTKSFSWPWSSQRSHYSSLKLFRIWQVSGLIPSLNIQHTDYGPLRFTQSAQTTRSFQILSQLLFINPLNAELNPICCLLALLGAHHFLHVSRIRVNYPTSEHHTACSAAKLLTQTATKPAHLQEASVPRSCEKNYCNLLSGVRVRDVIH